MHHQPVIRSAVPSDEVAVLDLALVNEMFAPDELGGVAEAFRGAVAGDHDGHQWYIAAAVTDGEVIGAAYVAPEPFADRLWNLYFLAVHPSAHGQGAGTALVGRVEQVLRKAGEARARVLLVETSSTAQYAATRAFYLARGFDEEAQIRDFYGPGDDKVVFWKALTS